jgi:hypothetical protein
MLTINLLQALPKTPLWDRLERENRLNHDENRDSNVEFLLPYDHVVSEWQRVMKVVYAAEKLFERYEYQCDYTYAKRVKVPASTRATWPNIKRGLIILRNVFWRVGVLSDYKRVFWRFALKRLRKGDIEGLLSATLVGHHLVRFGQEATSGRQNASNYSVRLREAAVPAE